MSISSEEVLLNALHHEIRREILRLISKTPHSYSQLLTHFDISTGKLNYHLRLLEGLIEKNQDGEYILTILGKKSLETLEQFNQELNSTDQEFIKRAYESQKKTQPSFLHLMYVTRFKFKFWLLVIISVILITTSSIMIAMEDDPTVNLIMIFMLVLGIGIAIAGFIWIWIIRKSAPTFIKRVDKILEKQDNSEN